VGDLVGRGDHAPHGAVPTASAAPAAAALQCRAGTEPERPARLRADHAVGGEAVTRLEALDGGLGLGTEDAIGGQTELALQGAHSPAAAVVGLTAARGASVAMRALALEHRAGAEPERLARLRADHAVDGQSVAALVALHRALGLRPEDAVGRDPERLLEGPDVVLGLRGVGAGAMSLGGDLARREPSQGDRGEHGKQDRLEGSRRRQEVRSGLRHVI
jgi:hypothetical protein